MVSFSSSYVFYPSVHPLQVFLFVFIKKKKIYILSLFIQGFPLCLCFFNFPFLFPSLGLINPLFYPFKKVVRIGSLLRQELHPMCVICAFLCALYSQL